MNKRLKVAQQLGDASLAIRIKRILEGLMFGRLPTALQLMGVVRSILYRVPRMAKALANVVKKVKESAVYRRLKNTL